MPIQKYQFHVCTTKTLRNNYLKYKKIKDLHGENHKALKNIIKVLSKRKSYDLLNTPLSYPLMSSETSGI